jgi:hypothetical protein
MLVAVEGMILQMVYLLVTGRKRVVQGTGYAQVGGISVVLLRIFLSFAEIVWKSVRVEIKEKSIKRTGWNELE